MKRGALDKVAPNDWDVGLPSGPLALRLCSLGTRCIPPTPSHPGNEFRAPFDAFWNQVLELQQGNPPETRVKACWWDGGVYCLECGGLRGACRCSSVCYSCLGLVTCFPGSRGGSNGGPGLSPHPLLGSSPSSFLMSLPLFQTLKGLRRI